MAGTSEQLDAAKPAVSIDEFIGDCRARQILLRMINRHGFSTVEAVEEIAVLTKAAAVEAAATPKKYEQETDALWRHADIVTAIIIALAKRTPHDQQSKLVDFPVRLRQSDVPHPTDGGVLQLGKERFWSGMPRLSINLAEEWLRGCGVTSEDELKNRDFANLVAFFAQLAEVKFETFFEDVSWSLPQLTYLFKANDPVTEQDVRVACMWLIHAPMKIWSDIEVRLRDEELELQYEPEFWPRWKQCLQDHQQTLSDNGPVNETRDLVKCALDSIDKVEATLRE